MDWVLCLAISPQDVKRALRHILQHRYARLVSAKTPLRYALLCEGPEAILFEQEEIGIQINRHCPWIPRDNMRCAGASSIKEQSAVLRASR